MNLNERDHIEQLTRDLYALSAALMAAKHLEDSCYTDGLTDYCARQLWDIAEELTSLSSSGE